MENLAIRLGGRHRAPSRCSSRSDAILEGYQGYLAGQAAAAAEVAAKKAAAEEEGQEPAAVSAVDDVVEEIVPGSALKTVVGDEAKKKRPIRPKAAGPKTAGEPV